MNRIILILSLLFEHLFFHQQSTCYETYIFMFTADNIRSKKRQSGLYSELLTNSKQLESKWPDTGLILSSILTTWLTHLALVYKTKQIWNKRLKILLSKITILSFSSMKTFRLNVLHWLKKEWNNICSLYLKWKWQNF